MQLRFEHFAVTSMMGNETSPPRDNGTLKFARFWEERAFGIALALSKKGHYEWEDFRQKLIASIAEWETTHFKDDFSWDYYQQWLQALEQLVSEFNLLDPDEWEKRTVELMKQEQNQIDSISSI
ncbi:nitrile hydratase accessory protein [Pleurocapsales cyanobacterium LEGE 06147]|nr:nitrile hydratase accessory protein [Pleurocapsales cyanobacterium LEGE 06147]